MTITTETLAECENMVGILGVAIWRVKFLRCHSLNLQESYILSSSSCVVLGATGGYKWTEIGRMAPTENPVLSGVIINIY